MQIDFSAAFDYANHPRLLLKLRDVGVGGAVFNVIAVFLKCAVQMVLVDGVRSKDDRINPGLP